MKPTMDTIARTCGVSTMTVSRVLAGKENVSAETREKILAEVARSKFEINILARNLAQRRSGFIGIATPFGAMVGSDYFGELLNGFQSVLDNRPWDFAMFDTRSSSFSEGDKLVQLHRTKKVDGLLVIAPNAKEEFLDVFSDQRIPVVVVGKKVANPKIYSVSCDDQNGVGLLCAHLYALGHRKIAFVGGPEGFSVAQSREQGYRDFCAAKKLKVPEAFAQRGTYNIESGRAAGLILLNAKVRPTAIIAANDMMAYGVIDSAHISKLSVPDDVSVAGFDDLPMASQRHPSLTTIHQPVREMAEASATLLLQLLADEKPRTKQASLSVSLVVRESTARPA